MVSPVVPLAVLLAFSSCSAVDSPELPAEVTGRERWIIERVARVRGLPFPTGVTVASRSREDLRRENEAASAPASAPESASAPKTSRGWTDRVALVLRSFGMAKQEDDEKDNFAELFRESALGIYEPGSKTLTMIDSSDRASGESTFAHETVHAIDDARFGIERFLKLEDCDLDRWIAGRCLVEGNATLHEMDYTLLQSGFDASMVSPRLNLWNAKSNVLRGDFGILAGSGPKRDAALRGTAPALVGILLLPYVGGSDFVLEVRNRRGSVAVNELFEHPPVSTEQVLHPEKYYRSAEVPLMEDIAELSGALAGAEREIEGTLGEYLTRVWLGDGSGAVWRGAAGDPGWDGDRFLIAKQGDRRVVLWRSVWESEHEASSAADAVVDLLEDKDNRHAEARGDVRSIARASEMFDAVALRGNAVDVVLNATSDEQDSGFEVLQNSHPVARAAVAESNGVMSLLASPFFRSEEYSDGTTQVDSLFGLLFSNESRPGGFDFKLGFGSLLHLTNTPDRALVATAFDLINWRRNARTGAGSASLVGLFDPAWSDDAARLDFAWYLGGVSSARGADVRRFDAHILNLLGIRYAETGRIDWSTPEGRELEPSNEFDLAAAVIHYVGDLPEKDAPCSAFRLLWGVVFGWRATEEATEWWTPLIGWDGAGDGRCTMFWGWVDLPF